MYRQDDIGLGQVRDIIGQIGIGRRGNSRVLPSAKDQSAFAYPDTSMVKLLPHEAMLIQRIHEQIVGEPWFNRNVITERELLKLILERHAGGSTDEAVLLPLCREAAQARFSRSR